MTNITECDDTMRSPNRADIRSVDSPEKRPELFVKVAQSTDEILGAQRLRYDVFTREYGAELHSPLPGIDCDRFDPFCDHLIVVNNRNGDIVATTRLLSDQCLTETGGFYSESEFDLTNIRQLPGRKLEIGRTCVHESFRHGATLALLWSGIARFVLENDFDYLIGCGSISLLGGHDAAWSVAEQLLERHGVEEHLRVYPRTPLPRRSEREAVAPSEPPRAEIPALIRAYTRLGASIAGEPCWDPDFKCADLFILLPMKALEARYARHFLKAS